MFKKALYSVGEGRFCHAAEIDGNIVVITEENGRLIRRKMTSGGGKTFGARPVSYGNAYFEFGECSVEIIGDTVNYEKTE